MRAAPSPVRAKRYREAPAGNRQLGRYRARAGFSARHFGMMTVRGHLAGVGATAGIGPERPGGSSAEAAAGAAGIRTRDETRDGDRRSPDFPGTGGFPVITLESAGAQPAGPGQCPLTGDRAVEGIARPVPLAVTRYGELSDPGMTGHRVSCGARGPVNRTDLGVGTGMVPDGRLAVGDEIRVFLGGGPVGRPRAAGAAGG